MMLLKRNRFGIILSIIVIWLPALVGVFMWSSLPDRFPIHYNTRWIVDGWSSKPVGVFSLPAILTVAQMLIIFFVLRDVSTKDLPVWVKYVILAIMPVLAVLLGGLTLSTAMGIKLQQYQILLANIPMGAMIILLGLVMKKLKPNGVIGIRVPWTLRSKRNWKLTHQFGSRMFIIGGILIIICGLLSIPDMFLFILLTIVILPVIYSYFLHRRGI